MRNDISYWAAPAIDREFLNKSTEVSIRRVCKMYNVTEDEMKMRSRKREYNEPRAVLSYLLRVEHNWNLEKIGDYFNRNHATAIHHINKVAGLMEVDRDYRQLIKSLI